MFELRDLLVSLSCPLPDAPASICSTAPTRCESNRRSRTFRTWMACDADVKSTLSQQHSPGGVNYVDHGRAVHLNGLETAAHMAEGVIDRIYA